MTQPTSRRLATEAHVASELADGLATKVNSSTYTAGLAAKQDVAGLGATVVGDPTVKAAFVSSSDIRQITQLTQAAYDALPVKDSATLYVVVG